MKIPIRNQGQTEWSMINESDYRDEKHLQEIIYNHHDIIPFEDIEPGLEKLRKLSIKELGLPGSGSTDVIVIDERGRIYIIETKLAKNPEAKRQVIGQILEYAAFLSEKDFDWLDEQAKTKRGKSLSEYFQESPGWAREDFMENISNNLEDGSFTLVIAVDDLNDELRQTTSFMQDKLGLEIHPLELRYFKDMDGTEVLLPKIFGGKLTTRVASKPKHIWKEKSFFEQATQTVDASTLSTIHRVFDFAKELGEVKWGGGARATFHARIQFKKDYETLFVITSIGKGNWYYFKRLTELGADRATLVNYISQLREIGFPFDEDESWNRYPNFDISLLNDSTKFTHFREQTLELKRYLSQA